MGRAASHITLDRSLQTHPNITIIGEEVFFVTFFPFYIVSTCNNYVFSDEGCSEETDSEKCSRLNDRCDMQAC